MKFRIEKNVPPPKLKAGIVSEQWLNLVKQMEFGDSVLVDTYGDCDGIRVAAVSIGKKLVTRLDKSGKHRCWMLGPLY